MEEFFFLNLPLQMRLAQKTPKEDEQGMPKSWLPLSEHESHTNRRARTCIEREIERRHHEHCISIPWNCCWLDDPQRGVGNILYTAPGATRLDCVKKNDSVVLTTNALAD
jgi:hypothetical protein